MRIVKAICERAFSKDAQKYLSCAITSFRRYRDHMRTPSTLDKTVAVRLHLRLFALSKMRKDCAPLINILSREVSEWVNPYT